MKLTVVKLVVILVLDACVQNAQGQGRGSMVSSEPNHPMCDCTDKMYYWKVSCQGGPPPDNLAVVTLDTPLNRSLSGVVLFNFVHLDIQLISPSFFEIFSKVIMAVDFWGSKLPNNSLPGGLFDQLSSIYTVNIRNCELKDIPVDLFKNVNWLENVHLVYNEIRSVPSAAFPSSLYHLELSFNKIEVVAMDAFTNLQNLLYLHMANNLITVLHSDTFRGLRNLMELDLRYNSLTVVCQTLFSDLNSIGDNIFLDDLDRSTSEREEVIECAMSGCLDVQNGTTCDCGDKRGCVESPMMPGLGKQAQSSKKPHYVSFLAFFCVILNIIIILN